MMQLATFAIACPLLFTTTALASAMRHEADPSLSRIYPPREHTRPVTDPQINTETTNQANLKAQKQAYSTNLKVQPRKYDFRGGESIFSE